MQDNACKLYFISLQLKPNSGIGRVLKELRKNSINPITDVLSISSCIATSKLVHYGGYIQKLLLSKLLELLELRIDRNFAIWQIVTQDSLNLDRFYSTRVLATIQYFKLWKSAMMDQFVTFREKGLLTRKDKK